MFKQKKEKPTDAQCQTSINAVQDALYVLHGKWKLPIIIALTEGKKRFSEIQKSVTGIAPKVLSTELKTLELNGFITRRVHDDYPVTVEYELTEYSDSLETVIVALRDWGMKHREKIRADYKNGVKAAV